MKRGKRICNTLKEVRLDVAKANDTIHYKNTDVLLMDPCYSREYNDVDFELFCADLVIYTNADGYYHVIKGRFEEMQEKIDEITENPKAFSLGLFTIDSARIGVYDYHKAIEEQPSLEERIQKNKTLAVIIKNFSGTITCMKDEDYNVYVVGRSDNGEGDFFTIDL